MSAKKGAAIQLQRKGLFIVDEVKLKPGIPSAGAADVLAAAAAAIRVPVGAEELSQSVAVAAAATPAGFHQSTAVTAVGKERDVYTGLKVSDIAEIVLFAIPDGHTKHEVLPK